ncbi:MAG: hypothetical protein ACE5H2_09570, partial [Terriglobia bacterium]
MMPNPMTGKPCVLCGALAHEAVLEVTLGPAPAAPSFRLLRCHLCQLVMTEPQLARDELEPYYERDYWGRTRADDFAWVRRDQRHRTAFLARFRRQGRLLD